MPTPTKAPLPHSDSPEYQAARARDLERLQQMKARMGALPPDQSKRVAKRALAMSYQRRAGVTPSYLIGLLPAPSSVAGTTVG
jgi:hypothetical protein